MEAATGAFFWADIVESTGATCYILHPYKFKIIRAIRELRRLFSQYYLLNRQVILMKNTIQAILGDNGVSLNYRQKTLLSSAADAINMLSAYDLSPASMLSIQINLEVL
jgi:hypothetical protein